MKKVLRCVVASIFMAMLMPAVSAQDLGGTWEGAWYRGMTSGTMVLEVTSAGEGTVQFVNLDNFGEAAVALQRVEVNGMDFNFRAAGEGTSAFVATTQLTNDGEVLKGKAQYEGFPIKFTLKRR